MYGQRSVLHFLLRTFIKNGWNQNLFNNPGTRPIGVVSVVSNLGRPVPKLLLHCAHCQSGAQRNNTKILNLRNDQRFWVCVSEDLIVSLLVNVQRQGLHVFC